MTVTAFAPHNRRRQPTVCLGLSRTEQNHRNSLDINGMMAKYRKTGILPQVSQKGFYGDFTNVTDFQDATNRVLASHQAFQDLPASVRRRFHNNPAELLSFLEDSANLEEAFELKLLSRPVEPVKDEPAPETPETTGA